MDTRTENPRQDLLSPRTRPATRSRPKGFNVTELYPTDISNPYLSYSYTYAVHLEFSFGGVMYSSTPNIVGEQERSAMKRILICAALSLSLAALPMAASAHGYPHRFYGHGGSYYHGGHGGGLAYALALPLIAGAAVLGTVATIATAPFYAAAPAPVYYGPRPVYRYAPAPVPYAYAPPPVAYGYPPPVCTYYPNGAEVCR